MRGVVSRFNATFEKKGRKNEIWRGGREGLGRGAGGFLPMCLFHDVFITTEDRLI